MGGHDGNQFRVVLRALGLRKAHKLPPEVQQTLRTRLESLSEYGLLNQFGYQRFGSGLVPTDALGLAIARGRVRSFCALLFVNDYCVKRGLDGLDLGPDEQKRAEEAARALGRDPNDENALQTVVEVAERIRA